MGIMPYQFEKGLFPTLLEAYFNDGLDDLPPTATVAEALALPGPAARLRAIWRFGSVPRFLRESNPEDTLVVTPENSFIHSRMFPGPPQPPDFQRTVAERWLGMSVAGSGKQRTFLRNDPRDWQPGATVGHWNGYYGNVELIVAEAVQRVLEVSLGLDHVDPPTIHTTPDEAKALEDQLAKNVTRVWPIYLFLTCPKPWFEVWITWQRHSRSFPQFRGQVTVILATPGHDRPVSPSAVDLVADQPQRPDGRPNPYYLHGREDLADGYDGRYVEPVPGRPRRGSWARTRRRPTAPRACGSSRTRTTTVPSCGAASSRASASPRSPTLRPGGRGPRRGTYPRSPTIGRQRSRSEATSGSARRARGSRATPTWSWCSRPGATVGRRSRERAPARRVAPRAAHP